MRNKIFWNGNLITDSKKEGRDRFYYFEDGHKINQGCLMSIKVEIKCTVCQQNFSVYYYCNLDKKPYVCNHCRSVGDKNPFFGKTHTDKTKEKIADANRNNKYWVGKNHTKETKQKMSSFWKGRLTGDKNPFYGKHHTLKTREILSQKTREYHNNLTKEEKEKISREVSLRQKKLMDKDPKKYKEQKSKGGKAAAKSTKKYVKNKLEETVETQLKLRDLDFKYSVIFCHKQFDFGNKQHKILLEVQGDYWHGNPEIYNEINSVQQKNKEKDKLKAEIAKTYGFKLFYIWERDVLSNNFSILDEIRNIIYEI